MIILAIPSLRVFWWQQCCGFFVITGRQNYKHVPGGSAFSSVIHVWETSLQDCSVCIFVCVSGQEKETQIETTER